MKQLDGLAIGHLPVFDRNFWDGTFRCTQIGTGSTRRQSLWVGVHERSAGARIDPSRFPNVEISVPIMAVIATNCFDQFVAQNRLGDLPFKEMSDARIAHAFQKADLPMELLGDLRALTLQVKSPLAIRSSSLLEDAIGRPLPACMRRR